MNPYDHEDAFKDANLCAGKYTRLADALKGCDNKDLARNIIEECKDNYERLFNAFIEGVEYGRRNPKRPA